MALEAKLLRALGEALDSGGQPHGRLFLTAPPRSQPRSTIYFIGDSSELLRGCQWIVKRPNRGAAQADLANPLDARTQFEALRRLAPHFEPMAPALRISRPVAFLPELGALAVEYANGIPLDRLARPGRLLEARPLLRGIALSGRFLRHLHALEPPQLAAVSARPLADALLDFAEHTLRPAGLLVPAELIEALGAVPVPPTVGARVRLHGDFAPINMLIQGGRSVTGIDIGLNGLGTPEEDLARFLMMLATQRLFLAGGDVPRVRALLRRAEATLIESYYGEPRRSMLLELRLTQQLCRRWLHRHTARMAGRSVLRRTRRRVVDDYFQSLLCERARALASSAVFGAPQRALTD